VTHADRRQHGRRKVGQLSAITRFAVKAVGGESLTSADVRIDGLQHDRRYAVIGADGYYLSHEDAPELSLLRSAVERNRLRVTLPGGHCYPVGGTLDAELSQMLGRLVRLRPVDLSTTHGPGALPSLAEHLGLPVSSPEVDLATASHLHVLSEAAVSTISQAHAGEDLRFRFTFLIDLPGMSGIPENGWLYRDLTIGEAAMTIFGPTVNCCAAHSADGAAHSNTYGVHALVRRPGLVRAGDPVYLMSP
jgi:uncharacterized protein YcbX